MTERRSPHLHNRMRRRLRDFVDRWGDVITLVFATVLVCFAILIGDVALQIRQKSIQDAHNSAVARRTSRQSCLRTREFGPALADAYERFHILSTEQLRSYRATIPRTCD